MSYEAPFEGLRVVDLSQGIAGPYCAMLLAQHGADVIKVEPPGGDWSRTLGIRYGDQTAYSIAGNLGKRSIVVDMSTALFTFQAVTAALYARMREPRGRYLQASLMQAGAALQTVNMIANHLEGGVMRPGLTPSGTFAAKDGWLNITVLRNEEFPALCDAIERPDLAADPRFADNDARFRHVGALTETLSETLRQRAVAEWSERLRAAGIMHERVNTHLDYLHHPHVEASGTVTWVDQPGVGRVPVPWPPGLTPAAGGTRRAMAPSLDEHGKEILTELWLADQP